jgi:enoyl-[acyl-carrier protein] reductase III
MDSNLPFTGKIALVTGSGRGIGRAIALHFAVLGADVVVNYVHNQAPAENTATQIRAMGRRALVVRANVGKPEDIERLFAEIETIFAGLDFLINNAAIGFNRPAMQQKVLGWDGTMNVNARAALFCAQKAVPMMEKHGGGAIVNISSPGSMRVLPDYVSVGASKAALEALTRYLAVELASKNIIVNAVAPGIVATDALQHFSAASDPQLFQRVIDHTPAARMVEPQDVAQVVAFLCTPAAFMIRGQVIVMDGGYTLTAPM